MKNTVSKLQKISLILSLIGIFFLFLTSSIQQPKTITNYSQLIQLKPNQLIQTTDKIKSIKSYGNFHIIKLNNNITLTLNYKKSNLKLKTNQIIQATGKLSFYKNRPQIQIEKFQLINYS